MMMDAAHQPCAACVAAMGEGRSGSATCSFLGAGKGERVGGGNEEVYCKRVLLKRNRERVVRRDLQSAGAEGTFSATSRLIFSALCVQHIQTEANSKWPSLLSNGWMSI